MVSVVGVFDLALVGWRACCGVKSVLDELWLPGAVAAAAGEACAHCRAGERRGVGAVGGGVSRCVRGGVLVVIS